MTEKFNEIARKRKLGHTEFVRRKSKVYDAFLNLKKAAYSEGSLSTKYKQLIAIGIAVVIKCEPCMQSHIEQAFLNGATEEEIFEAIEVGIELGGGPAVASARFALEMLDSVTKQKK